MRIILLLFVLSLNAHARWATLSDLDFSMLRDESKIQVKKDGTFKLQQVIQFKILKDTAKEKFSLYKLPYRASSSSLKVLDAKVENGRDILTVPQDKIVDRSLSKDRGIDDTHVVQIAFPQLQVNSLITIKFETNYHKVVVPGHFSSSFRIGMQDQADEFITEIESELPLHVKPNDPFKVLQIEEKTK